MSDETRYPWWLRVPWTVGVATIKISSMAAFFALILSKISVMIAGDSGHLWGWSVGCAIGACVGPYVRFFRFQPSKPGNRALTAREVAELLRDSPVLMLPIFFGLMGVVLSTWIALISMALATNPFHTHPWFTRSVAALLMAAGPWAGGLLGVIVGVAVRAFIGPARPDAE